MRRPPPRYTGGRGRDGKQADNQEGVRLPLGAEGLPGATASAAPRLVRGHGQHSRTRTPARPPLRKEVTTLATSAPPARPQHARPQSRARTARPGPRGASAQDAPSREPGPRRPRARRGRGRGAAHAQGRRAPSGGHRAGAATMEGGAYGAGKAGGAFDPHTLLRQPHTILRVVSWVRTAGRPGRAGGAGRAGAPGRTPTPSDPGPGRGRQGSRPAGGPAPGPASFPGPGAGVLALAGAAVLLPEP